MSSPTNLPEEFFHGETKEKGAHDIPILAENKIFEYPNIWEDEKAWFSSFVEVISPRSFAYLGCCQTLIEKALIENTFREEKEEEMGPM